MSSSRSTTKAGRPLRLFILLAVLLGAALLPFSMTSVHAETPALYVQNINVTQEALQAYNVTSFTINPTIHNVGDAIAVFVVSTGPISSVADTDMNPWQNAFSGYGSVYNAAAQLMEWVNNYPSGYISTVYTGIYSSLYVTNAVSTGSPVITVTMSANTSLIRYNFYEFASNATNVVTAYPVWQHTNSTVMQTAWLNAGHQVTLANTEAFFGACISSGGYVATSHNMSSAFTAASGISAPQSFAANWGSGWPPSGELAGWRTNVGGSGSESVSLGFQYWSSSGTQRIDVFGFGVLTSVTAGGGGGTGSGTLTLEYGPVPTYVGSVTDFAWAYSGTGTISYVNITTGDGGMISTLPTFGSGLVSATMPYTYHSTPTTLTSYTGVIVPLYMDPIGSGLTAWQSVAQAKLANPQVTVVAIANIDNGPDLGGITHTEYVNGIAMLHAAGIKVLGYVYTSYGTRSSGTVEADMAAWLTYYGVDGIFLDEMGATAGNATYYSTLTSYGHGLGESLIFGNPGTAVDAAMVGTVDNIMIYEGSGLPSVSTLSALTMVGIFSKYSFAAYGVSTFSAASIQALQSYVGYMFVTSDNLPNLYDTVPSYLSTLMLDLSFPSGTFTVTATAYFTDSTTLNVSISVTVLPATSAPAGTFTISTLDGQSSYSGGWGVVFDVVYIGPGIVSNQTYYYSDGSQQFQVYDVGYNFITHHFAGQGSFDVYAIATMSDGSHVTSNHLTITMGPTNTAASGQFGLSISCTPASITSVADLTVTCTVYFNPTGFYATGLRLENVRFNWGDNRNTLIGDDSVVLIGSYVSSPVTTTHTFYPVNGTRYVSAIARLSYIGVLDDYYDCGNVTVQIMIPGGGGSVITPPPGTGGDVSGFGEMIYGSIGDSGLWMMALIEFVVVLAVIALGTGNGLIALLVSAGVTLATMMALFGGLAIGEEALMGLLLVAPIIGLVVGMKGSNGEGSKGRY